MNNQRRVLPTDNDSTPEVGPGGASDARRTNESALLHGDPDGQTLLEDALLDHVPTAARAADFAAQHPDPGQGYRALVEELDGSNPSDLEVLVSIACHDTDPQVRGTAARQLDHSTPDQAAALLWIAVTDPDPYAATEALVRLSATIPGHAAALLRIAATAEEVSPRSWALNRLDPAIDEHAAALTTALTTDPHPDCRLAAMDALIAGRPHNDPAVAEVFAGVAVTDPDPRSRDYALRRLIDPDECTPATLDDPLLGPPVAATTYDLDIIDTAATHPNGAVRAAATRNARLSGEALTALLTDPDEQVRRAAATAVAAAVAAATARRPIDDASWEGRDTWP